MDCFWVRGLRVGVLGVGALLGLGLGLGRGWAQGGVLEAVLPQPMEADGLREGSGFVLEVSAPWVLGDCRLAPGAVLRAEISGLMRSPAGRVQGLTFTVAAPCGDQKPQAMVLTGLLAPPDVEEVAQSFPGFASFGAQSGSAPTAANAANFDPTGMAKSSSTVIGQQRYVTHALPKTVSLGEVWRFPHTKLVLPTGVSGLSTVVTTNRRLEMPKGTVFVLQPARREAQMVHALPTSSAGVTGRMAAPPAPVLFLKDCVPGRCGHFRVPVPGAGFGFEPTGAAVDLAGLGMVAERDREVAELGLSATVHFLGEAEVLVTFPTRKLVRRTAAERPADDPEAVKAVLLNAKTRAVERVVDWQIDDHQRYVWPVGNKLLVHQGHALVLYGPGLEEEARLPLELPLASLRAAPDGQHVVIGELRELHSRADHQMLMETMPKGPQEEVRWSLLDGHLGRERLLGVTSNFVPAPVLVNEGMIELRRGAAPTWFLVGRGWTSEGPERQMGMFRSSCFPGVDDVQPDLLAVTTCDGERARETTVVRQDGAPVVEQLTGMQELPVASSGASAASRIALMLTEGDADYQTGRLFRFSSLRSQRVEVYGVEDGAHVASIPLPRVAHYRQAFGLSPDGTKVVFLDGERLVWWSVGKDTAGTR